MTVATTALREVTPRRIAVVSGALPDLSLDDVVSALAVAGVDAIEVSVGPGGHLDGRSARTVSAAGARLADAGFRLCGVDAPSELPLGAEGLTRVLDIAAQLQAPFIRVYPPRFDPMVPVQAQLAAAAAALHSFATGAPGATATLLEPAPDSVAPSPELARQVVLASSVGSAGVLFDPGSAVAEGYLQPELALGVLGELVRHVHVKNRSLTHRAGRWISESRGLADGVVDWVLTLSALKRRGYSGWLSIDHLSGPACVEVLCADVAELRRLAVLAETSLPDDGSGTAPAQAGAAVPVGRGEAPVSRG